MPEGVQSGQAEKVRQAVRGAQLLISRELAIIRGLFFVPHLHGYPV